MRSFGFVNQFRYIYGLFLLALFSRAVYRFLSHFISFHFHIAAIVCRLQWHKHTHTLIKNSKSILMALHTKQVFESHLFTLSHHNRIVEVLLLRLIVCTHSVYLYLFVFYFILLFLFLAIYFVFISLTLCISVSPLAHRFILFTSK